MTDHRIIRPPDPVAEALKLTAHKIKTLETDLAATNARVARLAEILVQLLDEVGERK